MNTKILLLENDEDAFARLANYLETAGYPPDNIIRVTNVTDIHRYGREPLYLILADINNCPVSKEECLKTIQDVFPYTPIIVLTAYDDGATATYAIKQGAQDCLVKEEIDARSLRKAITFAVERQRVAANYSRLFSENPVPIYIYETETFRFLAVNNAALSQYMYTRDEMLSKTALDIRPEEDWERFKFLSGSLPDSYFDAGTWRHIRKNGEIFHVHIYAHSTTFEGKNASMVMAIDVENKVRAEAEASRKARQMQKVWESITDGLYVLNSNWEFTFVNKESERILRHPKEELLGKKAWDLFPNAKSLKLYHEYHRAVAEKVSVHFEEYVPTYDLWASINAYPTSEGLVVYLLDITAQKIASEKLQNEQEKLRAIINNTQDIIWSIDKNMQIIDANKPFWDYIYAMTGKTQQEVTESDFSKDLMKSWESYLQPAFEGKAYRSTIKNETHGHITYSEINFSPIYDKDKNIVGVSCFSRDITEERQHQEMVEHQNRQLKEIAWLQSHKVRNHVTTIQGLAQLFNHNDPNDPTNKQILDGIQATTAELDHVIKEINSKAQKLGE